ncbi:MAG: endo alpha-1,4 polygalactosaminidase [Kofleriaceae bacterium]
MRCAHLLVALAVIACSSSDDVGDQPDAPGGLDGGSPDAAADGGGALVLPPVNAGLDYQLGGAYPPPAGVQIVSRDRAAAPAVGLYNICYVNGFQIQPDEESFWQTNHPELILRDGSGNPVIDPDWNEMLIDVSTPAKRTAVAAIVGGWITGCQAAGFDAIEIDNLDTFSRSGGRLTEADAVAQMRLFADVAHGAGLPIAQKNAAELVGRKADLGTDFVVTEECSRFQECDVYTGAYGDHVLAIEYRRQDFTAGCAAWGSRLSIVLRDVNLVPSGQGGYVFDGC